MKYKIIGLLLLFAFGLNAQGYLSKEYIEPAIDSNYVLVSAANGVLTYAHKDSLNLAIEGKLNIPANDGYFASWDSLNNQFAWVMQISTPTDSVAFNSQFAGDGSLGDPISLASQGASEGQAMVYTGGSWQPESQKNGFFSSSNQNGIIAADTAYHDGLRLLSGNANFEGNLSMGGNYVQLIAGTKPSSPIPFSLGGLFASAGGASLKIGIFDKNDSGLLLKGFFGSLASNSLSFQDNTGGTLTGIGYDPTDFTTYADIASNSWIPRQMLDDTTALLRALISSGGDGNGLFSAANQGATIQVSTIEGADGQLTLNNFESFKAIGTHNLGSIENGFIYDGGEVRMFSGTDQNTNNKVLATTVLAGIGYGTSATAIQTGITAGSNQVHVRDNRGTKTGLQYNSSDFPLSSSFDNFDGYSIPPLLKIREEISDSLATFTAPVDWLGTRLASANTTIDETTRTLTLKLRGVTNDNNTFPSTASKAVTFGVSNFNSGGFNGQYGTNASIVGYAEGFGAAQSTATYNTQLSTTGAYIYEDSDYNLQAASVGSELIGSNFNTVVSCSNCTAKEVERVVMTGKSARAYRSDNFVIGTSPLSFSGTAQQNRGASQKTDYTFSTRQFRNPSNTANTIGFVPLDTMPKTYILTIHAQVNISDQGDGSLPVGEGMSEVFMIGVKSNGTTATIGTGGKQSVFYDETSAVFSGNSFTVAASGNLISITNDIGLGVGTLADQTITHSRVYIELQELSYVDY